MNDTDPGL